MQHHLVTGSDSYAYALFDPAALEPYPENAHEEEWSRWMERQVAAGRVLECAFSDGLLEVKLLVDEPFEHAAAHERQDVLDGALLRVPSGRLYLRGIEFVHADDGDDQAGEAENRDTGRTDIPAGTYRITAFRVEYRVPQARRDEELQAQLQPGDVRYVRAVEKRAVPVGCAVVLFAFVASAVFIFSASTWAWRFAAVGIAIGIAVFALTTVFRLMSSPRVTRYRKAEAEMDKRYPKTIVMLQRLADDAVPETFAPARFGAAAGESDAADDFAESQNRPTPGP